MISLEARYEIDDSAKVNSMDLAGAMSAVRDLVLIVIDESIFIQCNSMTPTHIAPVLLLFRELPPLLVFLALLYHQSDFIPPCTFLPSELFPC
jgi:hypothetical protein